MKKLHNTLFILGCLSVIGLLPSCSNSFLEKQPQGSTSDITLANSAGVNGLLIGAYSLLDGLGGPNLGGSPYSQAVSNWVFGGVASDDAHKGSTDNDQSAIADIEKHKVNPTNSYLRGKWGVLYAGAQRANDVIRVMAKVTDGSISPEQMTEIKAEAVFLRAVFHLEAAKIWGNVPYVGDSVDYENGNYNVPNSGPIWPQLEADFQFAADNLSETQQDLGRANSWAAKAFLAKVYMFEHKYNEAQTLLTDIIANGVTAGGEKYALVNFADNFNPSRNNNSESVFAVQMTVHDKSNGNNSNDGDILNFPGGGETTCCGFYQPSFSLVNSFKTDPVSGLPLLDTWNDADVKNDQGIPSTQAFTPYTGTLDPRLDWTVGRRGIPLLDWGIMPGQAWVRAQPQGGPYVALKGLFYKAQEGTTAEVAQGWGVNQGTSNNYEMIRFADVLLWAAECETEVGSLDQAETYVNMVRNRAADEDGWVKSDVADGGADYGGYAANYFIKPYPDGYFSLNGQDYARKAIRFERKIELAMEGHRFFDLQRWDNGTGYMADVLNAYIAHETGIPNFPDLILQGAQFTKGTNELFPIPQTQIDLSVRNGTPMLTQNPGY